MERFQRHNEGQGEGEGGRCRSTVAADVVLPLDRGITQPETTQMSLYVVTSASTQLSWPDLSNGCTYSVCDGEMRGPHHTRGPSQHIGDCTRVK